MLVSILIPCYNAERWVAEAIESALAQTWQDKEVIVVDDGSQDRSLDIIKSFGDRIRWEAGPNRGGNMARNRLLEMAKGEWLQYLDADDYLLPPKIERQVAFLRNHPECDIVYSPVWMVNWSEEKVEQEITPIPEPHDPWILLARWWLPQTGGPLWNRESIINAGGWRPDQPCCQEHELYLRLLKSGANFCYFDDCNSAYRNWSKDKTVSKRNKPEVRRQRLIIKESAEEFLALQGELTWSRLQALNQGRFEIARMAWLEDQLAATEIVSTIQQRQPKFLPEGPAARGRYRWIFQTFGFAMAERIAELKRKFSGMELA